MALFVVVDSCVSIATTGFWAFSSHATAWSSYLIQDMTRIYMYLTRTGDSFRHAVAQYALLQFPVRKHYT